MMINCAIYNTMFITVKFNCSKGIINCYYCYVNKKGILPGIKCCKLCALFIKFTVF